MPVLLCGLEACPLRKSDCSSLDFVVNRFFMKLFKTNNIDVVNYCRMQFNFELLSVTIAQRSRKFAGKYRLCDNALYPRLARSAIGVDTVLTLDVCLYVCMLAL